MKKNLKGFTLVEVLIVIIIVGILIAALLPRLVGTQARARDTARAAAGNQIAQGVAMMSADRVAITVGCVTTGTISSGYLSSVPLDPQGSSAAPLTVAGCSTAGQYALFTTGGQYVVVTNSERSAGNCTVTGTGTVPVTTLTNGSHFCTIVQ